jgi:hypothetical protein
MKIKLILILLIFGTGITSCSKDDDSPTEQQVNYDLIKGDWHLTAATKNGESVFGTGQVCYEQYRMIFTTDVIDTYEYRGLNCQNLNKVIYNYSLNSSLDLACINNNMGTNGGRILKRFQVLELTNNVLRMEFYLYLDDYGPSNLNGEISPGERITFTYTK